jgi:AcrR family transcriptional regulator
MNRGNMPRSRTQNEAMRAVTRTAVLNSAMTLFAQNGYAHTSTRAIAKKANISAGLMYHYFDTKESLLRAVFDNCMAILNQEFTAAYEQSPPQDRLVNLLTAMFNLLARDKEFWALFYMLRTQPAIMRILGDDFRHWTQQLRLLFQTELQQANCKNPEIDALLLYSLVEGTIQQYLLDPETYPLAQVVAQIITQYATQDEGALGFDEVK